MSTASATLKDQVIKHQPTHFDSLRLLVVSVGRNGGPTSQLRGCCTDVKRSMELSARCSESLCRSYRDGASRYEVILFPCVVISYHYY
jgi:hypothetical protein